MTLPLRNQIVSEIMSLVRQPSRKLEKPTIDELERIINSESTDAVNIEPDGSVSITPTATTVGAVADKVVAVVKAEIDQSVLRERDLAMMLRRMIWQADKASAGDTSLKSLAGQAKQLLAKYGLEGSPLRDTELEKEARMKLPILAVAALCASLGGCVTAPSDPSAPPPTAAQTQADRIAQAKRALAIAKLAAHGAEIVYQTYCSSAHPKPFCTDPKAVATYADAKALLDDAFQAADDALSGEEMDDAKITQLVGDAAAAAVHLEQVIADLQSGSAPH